MHIITLRGGRQRQVAWTDEQVTLNSYGKPAPAAALFEQLQDGAQAISGGSTRPGRAGRWLRGRWAEENMFKYDMINYCLVTLADYDADEVVNTKLKANPPSPPLKKLRQRPRPHRPMLRSRCKLLADPAIAAIPRTTS